MRHRTKTNTAKKDELELNMTLIKEVTELLNKTRNPERVYELSEDLRELVRLRQEIKDSD